MKNRPSFYRLLLLCLLTSFVTRAAFSQRVDVFKPSDPNLPFEPYSWDWNRHVGLAGESSSSVNPQSGAVGVYATGVKESLQPFAATLLGPVFISGGTAEAWQYVQFFTPIESTIEGRATIKYVGGFTAVPPFLFLPAFAAFGETEFLWNLDNGDIHRDTIEGVGISWGTVASKAIVIGSLLVPFTNTIGAAINVISGVTNAVQFALDLNALGDARTSTLHFKFTASPGYHVVGVGFKGSAAGAGQLGYGLSLMFGQLEQVELHFDHNFSGPADVTVSDFWTRFGGVLEHRRTVVGEETRFRILLSNFGEGPALGDEVRLTIEEPGMVDYHVVRLGSSDLFYPHNYQFLEYTYTFQEKGTIPIKIEADPDDDTIESDEGNNLLEVTDFYVIGHRPTKPTLPTGLPANGIVYRNETYTLSTSSTDPESDVIYYSFELYDRGTNQFIPVDTNEVGETELAPSALGLDVGSDFQWSGGRYEFRVSAFDDDLQHIGANAADRVYFSVGNRPPAGASSNPVGVSIVNRAYGRIYDSISDHQFYPHGPEK